MKKKEILWNEEGWTVIQEADAEKHVLEVSCKAENGMVTEVRIRHNDGERTKGKALIADKPALPMSFDDFKTAFTKGKLQFK